MRKTFLEQNPFYILEVSPNEKRASIISKAEEKAFFADGNECEEAQAKLLNPEKRLSTELDWFYEISIEKMADIHNCISESKEIAFDDLKEISRLNAVLHNFSLSNYDDYFELGYAILEIDELYNNVNITDFLTTINTSRQQSGLREVLEEELEREFNKKRDQIRQLISDKTINLNEEDYIDFITMIAEKCIADEDYNDGIVISDIVDQYEIKTQDLIEEAADEIYSHINRIKEGSNDETIEDNVNELIKIVKKWDRLAQPLQLKSMASGVAHEGSEDVGRELRELSIWFHNEKGLSDLSLRFIDAMKPIFAEIGDLFDVFESDRATLANIIKENKESEEAIAELDSLKTNANSLKVYATSSKVDEFINAVRAINKKVKQISLDAELLKQVRTSICYIARDVAITMHNDKQQTDYALRIAKVLREVFGDIYELKLKLDKDVDALSHQSMLQGLMRNQQSQEDGNNARGTGCLIIGVIFLIIFLILCLSQCNSSSSSSSSKSSSSSGYSSYYDYDYYDYDYDYDYDYSSSSNDGYSSTETMFSQGSNSFDKVYIDIVSIEPSVGIGITNFSNTDVACECKTSTGRTVWVYMSVSEYNRYIDSSANISNSYAADYEVIEYSTAKRIHGTARTADSLCDGLSSDTGTMILKFSSID